MGHGVGAVCGHFQSPMGPCETALWLFNCGAHACRHAICLLVTVGNCPTGRPAGSVELPMDARGRPLAKYVGVCGLFCPLFKLSGSGPCRTIVAHADGALENGHDHDGILLLVPDTVLGCATIDCNGSAALPGGLYPCNNGRATTSTITKRRAFATDIQCHIVG